MPQLSRRVVPRMHLGEWRIQEFGMHWLVEIHLKFTTVGSLTKEGADDINSREVASWKHPWFFHGLYFLGSQIVFLTYGGDNSGFVCLRVLPLNWSVGLNWCRCDNLSREFITKSAVWLCYRSLIPIRVHRDFSGFATELICWSLLMGEITVVLCENCMGTLWF